MDPDRFLQAKEILLEALERRAGDRVRFVNERCGDDVELRREVLSLLEQEDRSAPMVDEGPLASGVGRELGSALDRLRDASTGEIRSRPERIGSYEVVGVLGEGGMGVVYHARQHEPIEREVAIKLIRRGMDTDRIVARFEWERKSLARMDHPHIASVLDAGSDENGRPYFVMQLTVGSPITSFCDDRRLDLRARLLLFLKICRAVQHAHQRGILHRDLKPSNILVRDVEGEPVPSIIDFGISKALSPDDETASVLTQEGQRIGTPAYMSPEQLRSEHERIDIRSDVYALGVILYELLTGRHPLGVAATTFDASAGLQADTAPQAPSTAVGQGDETEELARRRNLTARRLRRELSGDLDNICLMAVRPELERRYASVVHLIEDIERTMDGRPVSARPDRWTYRLGKFARRHRLAVSLAAAGVAFAIVGVFSLIFHADRLGRERDRARAAETHAQEQARAASEIAEFLEELFKPADPGEEGTADATARELLDRGATRIHEELADQPAVRGRLLQVIGRVYQGLGLHVEAEELLLESINTLASVENAPQVAADQGASYMLLGTILHDQGRYDESEALYQAAAEVFREAHGERSKERAEAVSYLGVSVQAQGRLDEAAELVRESIDLNTELRGEDDPEVAWARNTLGYIYYKQGKLHEAGVEFRRAFASQERTIEGDHIDVAHSLNNLGGLALVQGRIEEALRYWQRALEMYDRIYDGDHPALARAKRNLGRAHLAQGELTEAERLLEDAYASGTRMLGAEHPRVSGALLSLAELYEQRGETERAESALLECLRLRRERDEEDRPRITEVLAALGGLYLRDGQAGRALELFERVLPDHEQRMPPDHYLLAALRTDVGEALLRTSQPARAAEMLDVAHGHLEAAHGDRDARTMRALDLRIEAHQTLGNDGVVEELRARRR